MNFCARKKKSFAQRSFLYLYAGTQNILSENHDDARDRALMIRYQYLEQHVAAVSEQTQAQTNFPKMNDAVYVDMH